MTEAKRPYYSRLDQEVAERYSREGYEVIVNPDRSQIPFDLGGYEPDLIARKGEISLIVEIKGNPLRTSFDRFRYVAHQVRKHEGWRFILVTPDDLSEGVLPTGEELLPTQAEIDSAVERAGKLKAIGDLEAAFFAMWVAFERMLRVQATRIGMPIERLSPSILMGQLYSLGELTMEEYDTAKHLVTVRNQVVHGIKVAEIDSQYLKLEDLVKTVRSEWGEDTPTTS